MPDGRLEPSVANRNMLIGLIRKLEPDLIVTNRLNDYHPDHRYTSQLVQDASYMLMVPRIVPEIPPMRYVPVIAYWGDSFQKPTAFRPDVVVGIDDVLDTKIAMLMRHESQIFEWLPWIDGTLSDVPPKGDGPARRQWALQLYKRRAVPPYADRYRDKLTERYGTAAGSRIVECEAFEISEYGHALSDEQSAMLFGGM
jgi:LmbE family N-acetylglucosaminyl deacetylase